ncbi:protein RDM16 isoform X1 [Typha latifolia]|uniref:protein RDM16 isoform X1 n=2 Tax=Typha latifolia TaxID=4733 RepID=UPI003C2E0871
MDRVSERDRSTRRSRDERDKKEKNRERDRDSSRNYHRDRDRDQERDRDHKHRNRHHREEDDERRRRRSRSEDSPSDTEHRREKERRHRRHQSRDESPSDVEGERSASRTRDSVDLDGVENRRSSRKRKEHSGDEELDGDGKRVRVFDVVREEKRERRRFDDDKNGVRMDEREEERDTNLIDAEVDRNERKSKEGYLNAVDDRKKREKRKFSDGVNEEETKPENRVKDRARNGDFGQEDGSKTVSFSTDKQVANGNQENDALEKGGSAVNNAAQKPLVVASKVSVTSSSHPLPTKVSSITTTNENEGVSIRSDEVPGKSSTDGTATSTAGKSGNLSLDALAKAKKALQLQKELSEKLKKIPALNKLGSTSSNNSLVTSKKDENRVPLSGSGTQSAFSFTTASAAPPEATANLAVGSTSSGKQAAIGGIPELTNISNIEAVKRAQELAAKMGFRQDPEFAPLINMFPGPVSEVVAPQRPAKAPVLRLDAQGREIDEHGNVINMPKLTNLSTLKVNINKQKKEAFQIIRPDLDSNVESNPHFDPNMGINKTKLLRPKRPGFQFVEEGKMSKIAEMQRIKSQFGEAQAKELKVKQAQLAKAKAEADINPNLITVAARVSKEKKKEEIPDIEWWDKQIILSGSYDVSEEKLNMDKITIYIEHPRPIEPPAEPAPPPPQPLKLTKKEQKKLRTQRRLAKERDRQEMIRQGLLEPPKAKVKMSNLMKVLGTEATQDPTRLEMEIRSAAAEREQAHVDRNIARKLTPAERREKKERKLFEDQSTLETLVSVYKIRDLSHPQTRFKVDVNAQENRLTGCVVISDGISVVVVEGGRKPIKRYSKLMLQRIDWAAAVGSEDDADEKPDEPTNSCVLVWQGSVAKSSFNKFLVHQCRSEAAARKLFADAGVPHYWDLAVNFSEELL